MDICWRCWPGFQITKLEIIQVHIIKILIRSDYQVFVEYLLSRFWYSNSICIKQNSTLLWNYKLQNEFEISYFNRKLLLHRCEPFRKLPNSSSRVPCLVSKTDNIQEQVKQWQHIPLTTLVMDRIQYGFNNCCFSWVYVFTLCAYNNILEENISSSNWWNISIKPLF